MQNMPSRFSPQQSKNSHPAYVPTDQSLEQCPVTQEGVQQSKGKIIKLKCTVY